MDGACGCPVSELFAMSGLRIRFTPSFSTATLKLIRRPTGFAGEFQVGEHLRRVNRRQRLRGLQLHNHCIVDEQIRSIACVEMNALIHQRNRKLVDDSQPRLPQFEYDTR